ncbi:uncharacterized protein BT62DRAFT_1006486 [Guyanagaster necrorhizus]|uniref:Uncharacterized protein n=1 Tax=Guyanagaster necrorhizus TaxID=856835 RepID=A0A9P7VSZ8_9AGAR|nr:uncharacterized protein BT62DRAFT_1006486 [Guyanagaster necrorhizus MCA 3950]KAG7445514.1 hypothetical protein BT62DRAFT_1006486 [Guyanagaster necrorhizus MCA 3950]
MGIIETADVQYRNTERSLVILNSLPFPPLRERTSTSSTTPAHIDSPLPNQLRNSTREANESLASFAPPSSEKRWTMKALSHHGCLPDKLPGGAGTRASRPFTPQSYCVPKAHFYLVKEDHDPSKLRDFSRSVRLRSFFALVPTRLGAQTNSWYQP